MLLSTPAVVHLGALGVHVRVAQRVAGGVALGRRRVLGRVAVWAVRVVLEGVRAGIEAQVAEFAVALLRGVAVAEVLQVHEPLGPEAPADALAVHGQVDELPLIRNKEQDLQFVDMDAEEQIASFVSFLL